MKSMTGYGRAKQELHGRTITAELRAVNHRYLDCTVKAPRQYGFLDDAVKRPPRRVLHAARLRFTSAWRRRRAATLRLR